MIQHLRFIELTKDYPSPSGAVTRVVDRFDLQVGKGEFVSLIGHSGCGKSTVLSMAAGLIEPSEGTVVLGAHEIDGPGPDRAVVFQSPSLFPWMTALENVLLGVRRVFPHATRAQRLDIARHYLNRVGLGASLHKKASGLSGGMRQRVGIARAFALKPRLLLLDEPFGMLDSLTRAELQEVLMEVWTEEKITAVMVTHDVDEALLLSDRVVMMTNGPFARVGDILTVPFARPRRRAEVVEDPAYYDLRGRLIGFLEDPARHRSVRVPDGLSGPAAPGGRGGTDAPDIVPNRPAVASTTSLLRKGLAGRLRRTWAMAKGGKIPSTSRMLACAVPVCTFLIADAQPTFHGQIRPRTEIDHKDLRDTSANNALMSTHLRTRVGFTAEPSERVKVMVELQDTRVFGGEPSAPGAAHTASLGDRGGVDLLQGHVTLTEGPLAISLGRQKMQLGAGRFLSTLEWHPYSRAFDGASAKWAVGGGDLTGIFFLVRDSATGVTDDRLSLSGLHYGRRLNANLSAEASVFYDQSRLMNVYAGDTSTRHDLVYLGQRVQGRFGRFAFEEEFIWQAGATRYGESVRSAAWQLALRAGVALPGLAVNAGVDAMSGDPDPASGTSSLYRANYYFAHAYFGWMDYFVSNPRHGVVDWRADADVLLWRGAGRSASLKAQYHFFTPQNAPSGARDPYGQEIDAELHLGLYPRSNMVLGAAVFLPGASASRLPAGRLAAGQSDQPGWFLYLMPTFNF